MTEIETLDRQIDPNWEPVPALIPVYNTLRAAEALGLLNVPATQAWEQMVDAINQESDTRHHFYTDLTASVPYGEGLDTVDRWVEDIFIDLVKTPDPLIEQLRTEQEEKIPVAA